MVHEQLVAPYLVLCPHPKLRGIIAKVKSKYHTVNMKEANCALTSWWKPFSSSVLHIRKWQSEQIIFFLLGIINTYVMVNFVSTWQGHRIPNYLVKYQSKCPCEHKFLDEINEHNSISWLCVSILPILMWLDLIWSVKVLKRRKNKVPWRRKILPDCLNLSCSADSYLGLQPDSLFCRF